MLPLVAVTGRRVEIGRVTGWLEPALALPTYYLDALRRAGAVGAALLPVPPSELDPAAALEGFGGLVLTGGIDLDPAGYGAEPHPATSGWQPDTDAWERALLEAALDRAMPVLAICRGTQLLNVALGGTLDQHLPDRLHERAHGVPNGGGGTPNLVRLDAGSRAAEAFGATEVTGRCHHHQAVDRLGEGLHVTGSTDDGVVEVIELAGPAWVVGVQWHPEDSAMDDPVQQRLFDAFVAQVDR